MSRGIGKLQRDLLKILEKNTEEIDTFSLTVFVYDIQPDADGFYSISNAQHTAVRRALSNLRKRGLVVEMGRRYQCNRCHWATVEVGLPKKLSTLKWFSTGYGVRSSPTKAAAVAAEIAEIQDRMKQLGL
jgi:hypothetical protein